MNKLKLMQKCAAVNFRNWCVTPKLWIVLGVMAAYMVGNIYTVLRYSSWVGIRLTPWAFPHCFNMAIMWLNYGFLTTALFSDAPFRSPASDFLEIRTGKRVWIAGQCLFVVEASLCYALAYALMTFLASLPRIFFSMEWGKLIEKLAFSERGKAGLIGITFSGVTIEKFSPLQATLLTILLVWFVSCFLGMLILAGRTVIGGNAGCIAAGIEVFLAYFCVYIGSLTFGEKIYRFAPVSWINLPLFCTGSASYPDLTYALSFLLLGIIFLGTVGARAYELRNK